MQLLEDRIRRDGKVAPGNVLRVDSFINHQMDIALMEQLAQEFRRRFSGVRVDKVLTVEASGIAIATLVAQAFGVPLVFAKKAKTAHGEALQGLIDLVGQAGGTVAGAGILIEKAFQDGGQRIRSQGVRVESLARVQSMNDDGEITFAD